MSTPYRLPTFLAGLLGILSAAACAGCPGSVERSHDGTSTGVATTTPPRLGTPGSSPPVLGPAPEPKHSMLAPGEALTADTLAPDVDVSALELLLDIRVHDQTPPPVAWGAIESAVWSSRTAPTSSLRVWLGAGRLRARVLHRVFALEEGWELRSRGDMVGTAVFVPGAKSRKSYRVVPPGALRSLLNERRPDVLPLAPSTVQELGRMEAFGRRGRRTRVETSYGTLELDQLELGKHGGGRTSAQGPAIDGGTTRHPWRDASRETSRDAGEAGTTAPADAPGEGAGEALCRLWLELIASERALFGAPCEGGMVPVRAEVHYALGGALVIQARSLREVVQSAADLAFPPEGALPLDAPLPSMPSANWSSDDALLGARARGEPTFVEVVNRTSFPRLAMIDGIVTAGIGPGETVRVRARSGRYLLSFRTMLGEVAEADVEVEVPSRVSTRQLGSTLPPPPSAMASVRNGP